MNIEDVLDRLGGNGRFQVLVYLALGLVNMRGSWHVFVTIFTGWSSQHYCNPYPNSTLNDSVPLEESDSGTTWSECQMYLTPGGEGKPPSNETVGCRYGWTHIFDSQKETSIASEWNLVCGREYLVDLSSTIYMVGAACGTLFLTPLSDRWGRKTVLLGCLWFQACVGIVMAFSPSEILYVALQFLIGITNMTIALCAYVLIVETFDKDRRELPALSLQFFWAGGIMLLSLFAYLLPNWRHLELIVTLPQILTVSYFWLLPESLTWLLATGRIDRARELILRIVRVNHLPPFEDLSKTLTAFSSNVEEEIATDSPTAKSSEELVTKKSSSSPTSYTVLDLFKTPRLRMFSIFMFYL